MGLLDCTVLGTGLGADMLKYAAAVQAGRDEGRPLTEAEQLDLLGAVEHIATDERLLCDTCGIAEWRPNQRLPSAVLAFSRIAHMRGTICHWNPLLAHVPGTLVPSQAHTCACLVRVMALAFMADFKRCLAVRQVFRLAGNPAAQLRC